MVAQDFPPGKGVLSRGSVEPSGRLDSEPVGENQVDQAGRPVCVEVLIADFVFAVLTAGIVAPVGLGAVKVSKAVFASQAPGTENPPRLLFGLRVGSERSDGTADEARRLRDQEVGAEVVDDSLFASGR